MLHSRLAATAAFVAVLAMVGAAFGVTLSSGFFMEDYAFLRSIDAEGGMARLLADLHGNWLGFTGYPYYRPLVTASFALDHAVYGLTPWGFHLTNVLLHGANACLVLLLVRRIVPAAGISGALAAALLFAAHPVHPNAVGWVAARSDLLVGLATLGMLVCFARAERSRGTPAYLGAILLFAAALASKESGAVAVGLAFALPSRWSWRRRLLRLAPCVGLLIAYAAIRWAVLVPGLDLHAGRTVGLGGVVASLVAQLGQVVNPAGDWHDLRFTLPLLAFVPAVATLFRREGRRVWLFAIAMVVLGLLPVVPIQGNLSPTLFSGFSRYWYLPVVGLALPAALAVGAAGRLRAIPLLAGVFLAAVFGFTSHHALVRDLARPAAAATAVASWFDAHGGGAAHDTLNVVLRAPGDRYGSTHVSPLAFVAAAQRPFTSRDLPIYPLQEAELAELVRVHGGHITFRVVTVDPASGAARPLLQLARVPRWNASTDDGPYRLPPGVWKDQDGGGRSPLAFDLIRVEGVKGTARTLLQVETAAGVFGLDRLADGRGLPLEFYFRRDPAFLNSRAVSRVRIEALTATENPLEGVLGVDRLVFADLPVKDHLLAPPPGARLAAMGASSGLRWEAATPRELGVRFVTAFGIDPPVSGHPLRPREGVPEDVQKRLAVGAYLGSGWFLVFADPPAAPEPGLAPTHRVPLRPLRAVPGSGAPQAGRR